MTKVRLFVRHFLGENIQDYPIDRALEVLNQARYVRDLQVGVLREAIVKAFDGD